MTKQNKVFYDKKTLLDSALMPGRTQKKKFKLHPSPSHKLWTEKTKGVVIFFFSKF